MAGENRNFCKKCDRSFRHLTTVCPNCGSGLVTGSAARSAKSSKAVEPLPRLPQAALAKIKSAASTLETPDYLGADAGFRGSDDPLAHERWEKSPRLDPAEVARTKPEGPLTAAGWAVVAIGAVIGALGDD
jgi:hypothetical protein